MMDMWRLQYSLQFNPRVPVRPDSVKELLNQKKAKVVQESDESFQGAGIGTMVDTIVNEATLQQIAS